jgi:hypothetical protein
MVVVEMGAGGLVLVGVGGGVGAPLHETSRQVIRRRKEIVRSAIRITRFQ